MRNRPCLVPAAARRAALGPVRLVVLVGAVLLCAFPAAGRGTVESVSGVVFVDADGDGARGPDEPGRPDVAVTNGREVVSTDADGAYTLGWREPGFVRVTCPADARCPVWFRRRGEEGFDFALVPAEPERDFFFVQISDAHVYPDVADMKALMQDRLHPWYLPRVAVGWVFLYMVDRMVDDKSRDEIAAGLRKVVSRYKDVGDAWDATVMMDYADLALDPVTGLVEPAIEIPHAFGEVAGLGPRFVISTGDMVLEGNDGEPEAAERWYRYYQHVVAEEELTVYETIGNNELAATGRDDVQPADPRYGRGLFWKYFGPSTYSFDRGPFHFVALDTHRRLEPENEAGGEWSFYEMEDAARDWLDADLAHARAAGRILVVVNHEPPFYDPSWDFDEPTPADDAGLLAKHDVAYSISGHIHKNGFQDAPPQGGTTHITTGALSGFRWLLPPTIDDRGYRVFYAHDGRLFSAWKRTDQPLLGFVSPRSVDQTGLHPASTHAQPASAVEGVVEVVAVGVDVDQPFAELSLWLGDEPLESERWGDYFVRTRLDTSRIPGAARLEVHGRSRDGAQQVTRIEVRRADAQPPGAGG